jgi:hypothetical protein
MAFVVDRQTSEIFLASKRTAANVRDQIYPSIDIGVLLVSRRHVNDTYMTRIIVVCLSMSDDGPRAPITRFSSVIFSLLLSI